MKWSLVLPLAISLAGALACNRSSEARAEAAPPAAAPAKAAPSARAEGQGFVVEVTPPATAAVGTVAKARVVLRPTGGYKVNQEFPTRLTVTAPAGVEVAKASQAAGDAAKLAEDECVFEVAFTPKEAGDKTFEAAFKFAVCTSETCDPKSERLAWTVPVK
jgi:hypothetical protein